MTTITPASEGADQLGLPWDLTEWVSAEDLLRWIDEDVATLDWNNPTLVAFLQAHPDFFITHTHLLADLVVPHESGGAVSLIERQVAVLRDQNRQVRRELADLVQIARVQTPLISDLQSAWGDIKRIVDEE